MTLGKVKSYKIVVYNSEGSPMQHPALAAYKLSYITSITIMISLITTMLCMSHIK